MGKLTHVKAQYTTTMTATTTITSTTTPITDNKNSRFICYNLRRMYFFRAKRFSKHTIRIYYLHWIFDKEKDFTELGCHVF